MVAAVTGAAISAAGLTGAAATVAGLGLQLGLSYAVSSLAKPSTPNAQRQSKEANAPGGDQAGKIIYGRTGRIGGTPFMFQKYNGFVYYGIVICRHACEEIEAIYLGDKPEGAADYYDTEFSTKRIEFDGAASADGVIEVTLDGTTYSANVLTGDDQIMARDAVLVSLPALAHYEYSSGAYDNAGTDYAYIDIKRISGTTSTFDVDVITGAVAAGINANILTQEAGSAGAARHRILYELGTQSAAHPDLVAELDFADAPMRWTDDHKLLGCTWVCVRWPADWLAETIGRIPPITVVLKGNSQLYDPRTATTGYSANLALCARDYLKRRYQVTDAQLPDAEWIAAANLCDEAVTLASGTQPRYEANGIISNTLQAVDGLKLLADAGQAPFMQEGGAVVFRPAAYRMPLLHIDENDLAGNIVFTHKRSVTQGFNRAQGLFTNELQEWQAHSYPSVYIDDGLPEKSGNLSFALEIDATRAQRLAKLAVVLQSNAAPVRVPLKILPIHHLPRPDTFITLSYAPLGWENRSFYVDSREFNDDLSADLILLPREAFQYDWEPDDAVAVDNVSSQPVFNIREDLTL